MPRRRLLAAALALLAPAAVRADAGAAGQAVYQRAGCIACHGAEGGGSTIAPPLAGHTAEQVKHAVRNPQGIMPRFGEDKITQRELAALATYIARLQPAPGAAAPLHYPGALEAHHWMAHHALRREDAEHAVHHLTHARELATDAAHRAELDRTLALVREKRFEQAAHAVVALVGTKVAPAVPMQKLHLRLALGAIDNSDAKEASHHLRHYAEASSGHDRRHAEQLLGLLKKGNYAEAKKRLAHML